MQSWVTEELTSNELRMPYLPRLPEESEERAFGRPVRVARKFLVPRSSSKRVLTFKIDSLACQEFC
jgi:hypothetical protein